MFYDKIMITLKLLYATCLRQGVHKSWAPVVPRVWIVYGGGLYMWVLCMEHASFHHSVAWTFEVAPRFLENLWPLR
jgi:hypothetical protein